MPIREASGFCDLCRRPVLARRDEANHLVHALVSLFLCGLWIPVWIIAATSTGPWACPTCGERARMRRPDGTFEPVATSAPPRERKPTNPRTAAAIVATLGGLVLVASLVLYKIAADSRRADEAGRARLAEGEAAEARPATASPSTVGTQDRGGEALTERQRLVLRDEISDAAARERLFAETLRKERLKCTAVVVAVMKTKGSWEINCGSGTTYRMRFDHGGKFLWASE